MTLVLLSFAFIACGDEQIHSCEFTMSIDSPDAESKSYFVEYLEKLNTNLGFQAFTYVGSRQEANSPIVIEKGLKERTLRERGQEFIGLGGFYPDYSQTSNVFKIIANGKTTTEVTNSMRLHFDHDFVMQNLVNNTEKLETAAAHEFGHGLGFDHIDNEIDVMYFEVSGKKDYDAHYANMRQFFVNRSCVN